MNVLVTGATGFVGINVVEALLARGDRVVAFGATELPAAARAAFAKHGDALTVLIGDVRDDAAVERAFDGRRIDRMVHGAVITAGRGRELDDPTTIVEVNVAGTTRVIEAARRHGVGRIVHVSSGSAYGRALFELPRLYEEVTPERPETFYQITKFAGERAALRIAALHGLDLVCTRLGSVIGPWELDTGVRDTLSTHFQLARMAARGEPAVLPAREHLRDWVYSRDVAAGILALLDAPAPRYRLYNLASGDDWGGLARWCGHLRSVYPGFAYRVAAAGEAHNLGIAESQDRARMDIGRLARDIGFRRGFTPDAAYADWLPWLVAHAGWGR